jgi:hypothetical protein
LTLVNWLDGVVSHANPDYVACAIVDPNRMPKELMDELRPTLEELLFPVASRSTL